MSFKADASSLLYSWKKPSPGAWFLREKLQPSINGAGIAPKGAHSVHGQNPSTTTWAYQKDAEQEKIRAQLTWQGIDHKLRLIGAAPLQELG